MTTSGTTTFNYNRDQIIRAALRKIGAISVSETPGNALTQDCADQLNALVKAWMANGIHLWTTVEAVLFVQVGQPQYALGGGSSSATQVYTSTNLFMPAPQGATSVTVASSIGAAVGNEIGVTLDSGYIQWTTITSVVNNVVGIATPLTDSASSLLPVYIASGNIDRPLRIPSCRRWQQISNIEVPLIPLARLDYEALPNKFVTGDVTQYYYNPQGGAVNQGAIFLWPAPVDTLNNNVRFTWYRPLQDFDTSANTPDFPQEWINALIWNLADQMSMEFDCPPARAAKIEKQAAISLDLAQGWDREPESVFFGVNNDQLGGGGYSR